MKKMAGRVFLLFFLFLLGVGVGASSEEKERPQMSGFEKKFENLKRVDDEIFAVFQKQNTLCVQAVNAAIVGDAKTIDAVAKEVQKHTKEIERLGEKRAEIVGGVDILFSK